MEAHNQPPSIRVWGRTLAVIECAQYYADKSGSQLSPAVLEELSRPLFKNRNPLLGKLNTAWTRPKTFAKVEEERYQSQLHITGFTRKSLIALLGGGILVMPISMMVFEARVVAVIATIVAGVASTMGFVLAYFWNEVRGV